MERKYLHLGSMFPPPLEKHESENLLLFYCRSQIYQNNICEEEGRFWNSFSSNVFEINSRFDHIIFYC